MKVTCQYCEQEAKLTKGSELYIGREEYKDRWFWACIPCQAWVGIHQNSVDSAPMGTLANHELRVMRVRVHQAFDPIWEAKARKKAPRLRWSIRNRDYHWLASKLGVKPEHCHIANFDLGRCFEAIRICEEHTKGTKDALRP